MFPRRAVRWYDNRDTTLRVAIVGVFVSWCAAAPGFLISDFDFTNQNYTWDQYIGVFSNFPGCSLTYGEKELLYRCSRIRGVSVVVLLAKMQGESDLVQNLGGADRYAWRKDRAMGYGMIRQWREPGGSGEVKFYFFSGYSSGSIIGSLFYILFHKTTHPRIPPTRRSFVLGQMGASHRHKKSPSQLLTGTGLISG
jgi:hypothetical protein